MTDKKFTDEKIIHDLDCYENLGYRSCGYAIDLINRQKAEIERLESLCEKIGIGNDAKLERICVLQEELETAKAEAIKEFAERMKEHLDDFYSTDEDALFDTASAIDQIAMELTEKNC